MSTETKERIEFEMTEADLSVLLNAGKPVSMIALQCGPPRSPQENANNAWCELGKEMGFDGMTVKPVSGKTDRHFTAVPVKETTIERIYGADTINLEVPDRIKQLCKRGSITKSQRCAAEAFREMYENPLDRTPAYNAWAREQDQTVILGDNLKSRRMQLVIDLIIQGRSIEQIEDSFLISRGTGLSHLRQALNELTAHLVVLGSFKVV